MLDAHVGTRSFGFGIGVRLQDEEAGLPVAELACDSRPPARADRLTYAVNGVSTGSSGQTGRRSLA